MTLHMHDDDMEIPAAFVMLSVARDINGGFIFRCVQKYMQRMQRKNIHFTKVGMSKDNLEVDFHLTNGQIIRFTFTDENYYEYNTAEFIKQ
jgi:hypothetical protein